MAKLSYVAPRSAWVRMFVIACVFVFCFGDALASNSSDITSTIENPGSWVDSAGADENVEMSADGESSPKVSSSLRSKGSPNMMKNLAVSGVAVGITAAVAGGVFGFARFMGWVAPAAGAPLKDHLEWTLKKYPEQPLVTFKFRELGRKDLCTVFFQIDEPKDLKGKEAAEKVLENIKGIEGTFKEISKEWDVEIAKKSHPHERKQSKANFDVNGFKFTMHVRYPPDLPSTMIAHELLKAEDKTKEVTVDTVFGGKKMNIMLTLKDAAAKQNLAWVLDKSIDTVILEKQKTLKEGDSGAEIDDEKFHLKCTIGAAAKLPEESVRDQSKDQPDPSDKSA